MKDAKKQKRFAIRKTPIKRRHLFDVQTQTDFIIPVENPHSESLVSESSLLQKRTFSQLESVKQRSHRLTKMLASSSVMLPTEYPLEGMDSMFQYSLDEMLPPTVIKMQNKGQSCFNILSQKKVTAPPTKNLNPFKMVDMRKRPPQSRHSNIRCSNLTTSRIKTSS